MGMGFAPTWLHHVSLLHMTTLTTAADVWKRYTGGLSFADSVLGKEKEWRHILDNRKATQNTVIQRWRGAVDHRRNIPFP